MLKIKHAFWYLILWNNMVMKYLVVEVSKIIFCLPHWLLSLEKFYFLSQIIVLNIIVLYWYCSFCLHSRIQEGRPGFPSLKVRHRHETCSDQSNMDRSDQLNWAFNDAPFVISSSPCCFDYQQSRERCLF